MADTAKPDTQTEKPTSPKQSSVDSSKSVIKRIFRLIMMLSVPLALLIVGVYYYITSGRYASTDNAYVKQDIVSISSEVGGRIIEVAVRENEQVAAGDLLFRIDSDPFALAAAQADAEIAAAQVKVRNL